MLERELAQAARMASKANQKVEQLRKRLLAESEKSHSQLKRELNAARKRYSTANSRLKKARGVLRRNATPANQKKVNELMRQVQSLADSVGKITKAAYEAAELLVTVKADAVLEARKAKAADRAAAMVERAASRTRKKPAKKKAAAKKKSSSKKKTAPKRKAAAKRKAAPKKKAGAKRKSVPKKKAAQSVKLARPRKRLHQNVRRHQSERPPPSARRLKAQGSSKTQNCCSEKRHPLDGASGASSTLGPYRAVLSPIPPPLRAWRWCTLVSRSAL